MVTRVCSALFLLAFSVCSFLGSFAVMSRSLVPVSLVAVPVAVTMRATLFVATVMYVVLWQSVHRRCRRSACLDRIPLRGGAGRGYGCGRASSGCHYFLPERAPSQSLPGPCWRGDGAPIRSQAIRCRDVDAAAPSMDSESSD